MYIFKSDMLNPSVIFCLVFLAAAFDLEIMVKLWGVELRPITTAIIMVGTATFLTFSWLFIKHRLVFKKQGSSSKRKSYYVDFTYNISPYFFATVILIYLLLIYETFRTVVGSGRLLFSAYVNNISADTTIDLPFPFSILALIFTNAGFVWPFLLANYITKKNRKFIYPLILLAESIFLFISNGKRGGAVAAIFCFIFSLFIDLKKTNNRKLKRRTYILIAAIVIASVLLFQTVANTFGRDSIMFDPFEYISIYLGGPILNLDTSIRRGNFNHPVPLSETFLSFYNSIGENFNIPQFVYKTDRIFLSTPTGRRVGNVDTTFFDFYHDGGIVAVIILTAIMSIIISKMYRAIIIEHKAKHIEFSTIIFCYMLWLVTRSFFANSFYNWCTLSTIYTLIVWWLFSQYFRKHRVYIKQ